jgi:hypothetical protein
MMQLRLFRIAVVSQLDSGPALMYLIPGGSEIWSGHLGKPGRIGSSSVRRLLWYVTGALR